MSISKIDRIAELLVKRLPDTMISSLVGVSPSYISQLKQDQTFKELVADLQASAIEEETTSQKAIERESFTDRVRATESYLLDKIMNDVGYYTPVETLRAFQIVGQRAESIEKREVAAAAIAAGAGLHGGHTTIINGQQINVVTVHLPEALQPDIIYGENQEIIAIGGRTTTTMPTNQLQDLLDQVNPAKVSTKFGMAENAIYTSAGDS